jgi:hypothetical protein
LVKPLLNDKIGDKIDKASSLPVLATPIGEDLDDHLQMPAATLLI